MELKLTETETKEYLRYQATKKVEWHEHELISTLKKISKQLGEKEASSVEIATYFIPSIQTQIRSLIERISDFYHIHAFIAPSFHILTTKPIKHALIRAVKSAIANLAQYDTDEAAQERASLITAYDLLLKD